LSWEFADMRKRRLFGLVTVAVAFFATAVFESSAIGKTLSHGNSGSPPTSPTPVAGESWLNHLHRSFDETSMGKTGRLGPLSPAAAQEIERLQVRLKPESSNETVTLRGADLYRMNCRGCHGEDGMGAPPEINSVINPVRSTSAAAIMERMKAVGMDMRRSDATKLAQQSNGMLLDRLQHGGQDMPAFSNLREAEVNSLVAYLRQLAGVHDAERAQIAVHEPRVRVGEYIVKSTCHVCHSASGPNPDAQQLYEGAIPPLSTLTMRTTRAQFIQKVTQGAPVLIGAPPELFRGRMPVFYYLSEEEASDVYQYLTRYPPYRWATLDSAVATTHPNQTRLDPSPQLASVSYAPTSGAANVVRTKADTNPKLGLLPVLAALATLALMFIGFGFTVLELKRLPARKSGRRAANERKIVENVDRPDRELVA
jgi:mono/diheme cytochrome c family protein